MTLHPDDAASWDDSLKEWANGKDFETEIGRTDFRTLVQRGTWNTTVAHLRLVVHHIGGPLQPGNVSRADVTRALAETYIRTHRRTPAEVAAHLLAEALTALNQYRVHAARSGFNRFGLDDLRTLDEICGRSDLTVATPVEAMARLIEAGETLGEEYDTTDAQWWADTVADTLDAHGLIED